MKLSAIITFTHTHIYVHSDMDRIISIVSVDPMTYSVASVPFARELILEQLVSLSTMIGYTRMVSERTSNKEIDDFPLVDGLTLSSM